MLVSITATSAFINDKIFKLPKTIALTVFSVSISLIVMQLIKIYPDAIHPIHKLLSGVNFRMTVLDVMLGYLLFAGSLHINSIDLKKHLFTVVYLATIGVIMSTTLTGFILWYLADLFGFHLNLSDCLIFGAIISPTDPIAVMSFFHNVKPALQPIKTKITGEALFNDGVSILVLVILLGMFYPDSTHSFTVTTIAINIIQEIVGAIALGGLLGYLSSYVLAKTDDNETIILLSIAIASIGYIASSYLHISGPITMVVLGLLVGNYSKKQKFSEKTSDALNQFWHLIDGMLNAFLFILIGLELLTIPVDFAAFIMSIIGLFVIFISRFSSTLIPLLIKSRITKNTFKETFVLSWGGLRGAISIALALATPELPSYLIAITYLIVIMSIVIQGSTLKMIINKLY